MKYMSSAGDYEVDKPGRLIARAARISHGLGWAVAGALGITLLATIVRLLGPLIVRGGVDEGIAEGDTEVIITLSTRN